MAYDFQYWFDELVKLKKDSDKSFEDPAFLRKERQKWQKGKFTDLVEEVERLRAAAKNEGDIPSFKEYVESLREDMIDLPQFVEFKHTKSERSAIPYLNEAENAEVEKWAQEFAEQYGDDLSKLEEGFLSKLAGGVSGFLLGPTIGRIVANALGVQKGILYDMFTSRVVSAALGVAIAKGIGGEYKK